MQSASEVSCLVILPKSVHLRVLIQLLIYAGYRDHLYIMPIYVIMSLGLAGGNKITSHQSMASQGTYVVAQRASINLAHSRCELPKNCLGISAKTLILIPFKAEKKDTSHVAKNDFATTQNE